MSRRVSAGGSGGKAKLLDRVREAIRLKHYSLRTEHAYVDWIKRFIIFHQLRHPQEMGEAEVSAFLTHLARDGAVAASTQNQALIVPLENVLAALISVPSARLKNPLAPTYYAAGRGCGIEQTKRRRAKWINVPSWNCGRRNATHASHDI
jgi:hypothetical protein